MIPILSLDFVYRIVSKMAAGHQKDCPAKADSKTIINKNSLVKIP